MGRGVARVSSRWGSACLVALVAASCGAVSSALPPPVPPTVVEASAAVTGAMPVAPATFEGALPAVAPPVLPTGPADAGTWAVVVGIDDYPGAAHDLRSAGNDAADVDALLARSGVAPERRLRLADGQATAAVLRQALDWLVARAGPGSTAVFFFAGHVRQLGGSTEALVGADGEPVTDVEVADRLRGLRAARTWLVLAACFGGGFDEALAPGRILTAAAPAGRLAYENLGLRRSYLVEYLVRQALLDGRAPATVEAAFAWADAAIRRDHPGRAPVQLDHLDGDLALGLTPLPAAIAAPPPRPVPAPRPAPRPLPAPTTTTAPQERRCGVTMGTLLHCPHE